MNKEQTKIVRLKDMSEIPPGSQKKALVFN